MKKLSSLILSLACLLSAAVFAACNDGGDNSSTTNTQELCTHSFSEKSLACTDRVCLVCGEKVKANASHTYKAVETIAPTCVENGYTFNQCDCGTTMKNNIVKALGHEFGEYILSVEASCETVGVKTAECSRCKATDNTYTAVLEHTFDEAQEVIKDATCTENGYTIHYCTTCKESIFNSYVRAFGHTSDGENDVTITPDCEAQGYDTHVCKVCGEGYTDNYVAALGHSWVDGEIKTASCDSVGYKQQECSACHIERMSDMDSQKLAHTFGADGACSSCGQPAESAFLFSAVDASNAVVHIALDGEIGKGKYVLNDVAEQEKVTITFGKDVIDGLLAKGYTGLTMRFYNPDSSLRMYIWKVIGLHTEDKMANNYAANGYSDTCVEKLSFYGDNGELSPIIKEDGITMTMFHTVASGANSAFANSLGIEVEYHKPFDVSDKSMWFTATDNRSAEVEYTQDKGWTITATKAVDYDFAFASELVATEIANGKTKITMTFGGAFDGAQANGNPINCKLWVIPKYATGGDNWGYNVKWISGFTANGDGTYSVEIDLTDGLYDFTKGMFFHVSLKDVSNNDVGVCYIHDVVFS